MYIYKLLRPAATAWLSGLWSHRLWQIQIDVYFTLIHFTVVVQWVHIDKHWQTRRICNAMVLVGVPRVVRTVNVTSVDFAPTPTKLCATRARGRTVVRCHSAGSACRRGKAVKRAVETPTVRWTTVFVKKKQFYISLQNSLLRCFRFLTRGRTAIAKSINYSWIIRSQQLHSLLCSEWVSSFLTAHQHNKAIQCHSSLQRRAMRNSGCGLCSVYFSAYIWFVCRSTVSLVVYTAPQ